MPDGVRLIPVYDRSPLIEGAVETVTRTLLEAMATAIAFVFLILLHFRTSLLIALVLPLAAGTPFLVLWVLSTLGVAEVPTNIMSLAGIAVSIGVLVDSAVVMAENVMHQLKGHFGDQPVQGDVSEVVLAACRTVGRPLFFSVVIVLLSFLPVLALGGMEGRMFRPLALTKSFALMGAALLNITLVPALCTVFIRGRLRGDEESWIVRSMVQVYRPVLNYLLAEPGVLVWLLGLTFVVGLAPLGVRWISLGTLFLALVTTLLSVRGWRGQAAAGVSLVVIALVAAAHIRPLGRGSMTPLNEGMVMDMPITIPRASVAQAGDDLKARDMIFCRFPEVEMVVGKAGRAETSTDPAPLDMIETMISFRPREFWPRRKLPRADAEKHTSVILDALGERDWLEPPDGAARTTLIEQATGAALPAFEVQMRELAYRRNQEFDRELGQRLMRFAVEAVVATANASGSLRRRLKTEDVERLLSVDPHDCAGTLAHGPTIENVTALAQLTVRRLVEEGVAGPGAELLSERQTSLMGVGEALHSALGGSSHTVFTRLYAAVPGSAPGTLSGTR